MGQNSGRIQVDAALLSGILNMVISDMKKKRHDFRHNCAALLPRVLRHTPNEMSIAGGDAEPSVCQPQPTGWLFLGCDARRLSRSLHTPCCSILRVPLNVLAAETFMCWLSRDSALTLLLTTGMARPQFGGAGGVGGAGGQQPVADQGQVNAGASNQAEPPVNRSGSSDQYYLLSSIDFTNSSNFQVDCEPQALALRRLCCN